MSKKSPTKQIKPDPHFDALTWRHFPTDKTMNAFLKEYDQKSSRKRAASAIWIRGAVSALEGNSESTPIYDDLFSPRKCDPNANHSTTPRLVPYEIQDLLFSIATVRDEAKNLSDDAFAERVFAVLAKNANKAPSANQYVDLLTLSQFRIQQALLRDFEELLRRRFELLYNYIFMNSDGIHIHELKQVLEQIDYLLVGRSTHHSEQKNASAKQDLQALYASLLALRKEVLTEKAISQGNVGDLNWRDKGDPLVQALNKQLLLTSRSPTPAEVSDFRNNYNEYLSRYLDPAIRENVSAFSDAYRELHEYYFSDLCSEQVEKIVNSELSAFAQSIFEELDKMELATAASCYQPKSATVGYLRLRLTQAQEVILESIREPMRMLRAVYSIFFFSGHQYIHNHYVDDRISGAASHMIRLAVGMLEACRCTLPPTDENMTTYEGIRVSFEHFFSSVYEEFDATMLRQTVHVLATKPSSSAHYLLAAANLLREMCKAYVRYKCEDQTQQILAEFEQMKKLLHT